MSKTNAVIITESVPEIPKRITIDDNTFLMIEDVKIIITEYDTELDPLSASRRFPHGYTVGVKVEARKFTCSGSLMKRADATEQYGMYVDLPEDSKVSDIKSAILSMTERFSKAETYTDDC